MAGVFFYTGVIGLCLGIFTATVFSIPREAVLLLLLLGFALAVLWRRYGSPVSSPLFVGSIFLLVCSVGLFRYDLTSWNASDLRALEEIDTSLQGVVVREPDVRASSQHLYIKEEQSGELLLAIADKFVPISYGDLVTVTGTLTLPESFEGELGRTFNYLGYLRAQGVTYMMLYPDVSVLAHGKGSNMLAALFTIKHAFMRVLEGTIPEPQAGLAEGLLLGVKRALGEELEPVFRKVGIIHIVVLSGYNIMLVAEALMLLLSFFFRPRLRMIIGIGAIAAFALLVGLSATVIRASIMAALIIFARATGRIGNALRALSFAGVLMLLINPYLLVYDPGFQLSFLATLGLILVSPVIERFFHFAPTFFHMRDFLLATIATQIMVLPLLLFLIGEFSVVAVLVNVLVLPMVPVAMGLSFVTGLIGFVFPPLAILVGFIANLSLEYIIVVAKLFASLPFASFVVPVFPFWVVVVLYVLLGFILLRAHTRRQDGEPDFKSEDPTTEGWTVVPLASIVENKNSAQRVVERNQEFPFH